MKRIKKNQVIITALAIMIAVAGYINYAGNITDIISVWDTGESIGSSQSYGVRPVIKLKTTIKK